MNAKVCHLAMFVALTLLSGCDKAKSPATKTSAEGEILEGSASDAMLPLDTVRSQAPLAPKGDGSEGAGGTDTGTDKAHRKAPGETETREPQAKSADKAEAAAPAAQDEEAKPDAE